MKLKKLIAALLVIAMGMSQFSVALANKKTEAENKKQEAEENLKNKQSEINSIERQQEQLQGEINALDAELVNVMVKLSTVEEELSIKQDDLAQTKEDLEQAKKDEKDQYEAMKLRIRFMYEKGNTAMITSILESGSIADLLNRVEYVNEVYEYDRNLLTEYKETKEQVAMLEKQQEEEIQALEVKQQEFQVAQENYQATIARKQREVGDFGEKLAEAQALAARYQDTINAQNTIIAQENERERQEQERAAAAAAAAARENSSNNNSSNNGSSGGSAVGGASGGSNNAAASDSGGDKNPSYSTGVSGSSVVSYALKFVGNPYVWGGKDPNTGADCSGFTSYVYAHFGISIPSYSYSQRSVGKEVSYSNAKAGDLICYAGHVAIYMGNGQIVHAKGTAYGIVAYDNATYRPIITVRRVL
ncbi:MAG: hydrolase [Lachnospiraceae bacterium]|nr:hydrolase [Lachnospiraceae bacterium]